MTHYTRNIDHDKYKNCKIADPKQEIIKEGEEHISKVLTVKELIEVLSAIENKNLEVYVRGNTWMMVPCNQVIVCSGDGDCLLLASHMEYDKEKVVNDLTDYISEEEYKTITDNVLKTKLKDIAEEFYRKNGYNDYTYKIFNGLAMFKDIETISDLVSLSPEELAFKVGSYGEKGYKEVVNVLKMYGIDVNRYINYQYNVDILSFNLIEYFRYLSPRTYTALHYKGKIGTIGDLARLSPKELMQIKGIGKKGYNEVVNLLKVCGIDTNKYIL